MKHKTTLKKGLVALAITGAAPVGTAITLPDDRAAGTLFSQSGGRALAAMRFDRVQSGLRAETAQLDPL